MNSSDLPLGIRKVRHPERETPFMLSVVEVCGLQAVHAYEIGQKPVSRGKHWTKTVNVRNWLDQLQIV